MGDWGLRFLSWGYRKLGARAVVSLGLIMGIMTSTLFGLLEAVDGLDGQLGWLWFFTFLGVAAGWWLCRKELSLWLGGLISFLAGFGLQLVHSGGLLPHLWSLARASAWVTWRLLLDQSLPPSAMAALSINFREMFIAASASLYPLTVWITSLLVGHPQYDQAASIFIWSLALWLLAVWASWGIRRYENPILAAFPAGALMAGSLAFVGGEAGVLALFIGSLLLLMALTSHNLLERRWQKMPIPFSEELRFDVGGWSLMITLSLMLAALVLPSLSVKNLVSWFESRGGTASRSESPVNPGSFGDSLGLVGEPTPMPVSMFDSVRAPGLPRQHLLGSGAELGEQVVMLVSVVEPAEQQTLRYYWKSLTYDRYTGRGWETGDTVDVRYDQGQEALSELPPNHRLMRQEVRLSEDLGGLVSVSGRLASMNHDFVVAWRDYGEQSEGLDQFGAMLEGDRYQADSAVPFYTPSQLKEADGELPEWVSGAYLGLPETVPERVIQLAQQLVQNQPDAYDQAVVIERYLRTYPYTLDIDAPPEGRDVADYFLFDLRQGYCDYYATAMVVLARAVGLPARLAIGYASGLYDRANQRYIVTAADAHSWVEIYFPDFGWIPFEPTAGQPALERQDGYAQIPPDLEGRLPPFPSRLTRYLRLGGLALGSGLALVIITAILWWVTDLWRLRRRPPEEAITTIFMNVYRFGDRLGFPTGAWMTPYEYTFHLNAHLARLASGTDLISARRTLGDRLRKMTDIYAQSIYGPEAPDKGLQKEALQVWKAMRGQFWRLWLRSKLAPSHVTPPNGRSRL